MMSEAVVTFQTQLSGVMETVFKAAMYEITRLVEDSFLEEMTRNREQVQSLKRRLKLSESRRKERDRGGDGDRCADCGRVPVSSRGGEGINTIQIESLKEEINLKEEITICRNSSAETQTHKLENGPETNISITSPDVGSQKINILLKEESLCITPDSTGFQERWGVNLGEGSHLSILGKRFSGKEIHKSQEDWEPELDQKQEPRIDGDLTDQSEPLYQNRYDVDCLGGFDKAEYEGGSMLVMSGLGTSHGSPACHGEKLDYIGPYDKGDLEAHERAEHQTYHPQSRRGALGTSARTNTEVSGEFSCLLINEEGYLQDSSMLYPEQVPGESGSRASFQGQGLHTGGSPLASTEDIYGPSGSYSHNTHMGERIHFQTGGRAGRRHNCNQCSVSFSDSSSLKAHKQTHKVGKEAPYSCNQCGKSFTQACNLKVHQRIHSGQGLHLCSHCGKDFPTFSDLKGHKCNQSGDKPYSCTVCGSKFGRLWNLKLHRRIHTQEKPHQCTMCDKSFTRADILKVHQRTHTGERPYCCSICGLSFKRLDHLKSHQRKHRTDL